MKKAIFFAALALAAACNPPKYATYESVNKDFKVSVPWGWQVMTDQQDTDYAQTVFIGPFDPDFYLGAPSLSVRWFRRYKAHRLPDGRLEMYGGAADFIAQNLAQVYEPRYDLFNLDPASWGQKFFYKNGKVVEGKPGIPDFTLQGSGLKAKAFVVESPVLAPENNRWGISESNVDHKGYIMRKHAYVVVPLEDGFYVLTYPATARGIDNHFDKYRALIGSFMPRTAGPGGPKVRLTAPTK
jgi:hypothetical protein